MSSTPTTSPAHIDIRVQGPISFFDLYRGLIKTVGLWSAIKVTATLGFVLAVVVSIVLVLCGAWVEDAFVPLLIGLAAFVVLAYTLYIWWFWRRAAQQSLVSSAIVREGIKADGGVVTWDNFLSCIIGRRVVMLEHAPNQHAIYGRSQFATDGEWAAFVSLVREALPARRPGQTPVPSADAPPASDETLLQIHGVAPLKAYMRANARHNPVLLGFSGLFALFAVLALIFALVQFISGQMDIGWSFLFVPVTLAVISLAWITKPHRQWTEARRARSSDIGVSERGLHVDRPEFSGIEKWAAFTRRRMLRDVVMLYKGASEFTVYHRSQFDTDDDWDTFTRLVAEHVQRG